ncbi:TetR/AcrR family transcriptional regulator [Phytohabitans rumicis]|uniref:Transcriptional regulator n=1 Tax=Phytohabitans rumicis TaxID=1076125 RepID=A0A6V8L7D6_9ACTN|nr:TetR/AcrR family transcriptional regulator [Phytohabitans rumicis]GFJ90559.1 transcriptional regulator [Phytohabitans rumicis]
MPRAGLTPTIVVEEAAKLADEVGLERLTLAAVAQKLGVALPSLYKHIRGLGALQQSLAVRALTEITAALSAAAIGRSGRQALVAMATAYRSYAHAHPGRYAATLRAADPNDPDHVAAGEAAVGVIYAVLAGYGLTGPAAIDATRCLRSALHGFVALEAAGGFGLPQDVDRSYDRLVGALDNAFTTWPSDPPPLVDQGRTAVL